jgi:hypothetical protein
MKARVGLSGTDFSPKPYEIARLFHYVYAHRPQKGGGGLVNCNLGTGQPDDHHNNYLNSPCFCGA